MVFLMVSWFYSSTGKSRAMCIYIYVACLVLEFLWDVLEMHVIVIRFP